ncbi:MAG: DUF4386 domain-containing protein [Bacteroidota bacterium]|nr:DUF4386 domain-containing protein [Bacteroidota bacterium]
MNTYKAIGKLLILGAVAVFIPYTLLTIIFEYPDILRQETSVILTKFYDGGSKLIWTWFAFAVAGLPLLPAYILLGQKLENQSSIVRVATTIGVIGLIVQMVGLLRWTFVIPVIADAFVKAPDASIQAAAVMAFKTIHQFGGVILGEHLGQIFTITWTILMTIAFSKLRITSRWINLLGYISSFIYLLAQSELLQTIMPSFPVWDLAGFIGSTLWLVWLIVIGIRLQGVRGERVRG